MEKCLHSALRPTRDKYQQIQRISFSSINRRSGPLQILTETQLTVCCHALLCISQTTPLLPGSNSSCLCQHWNSLHLTIISHLCILKCHLDLLCQLIWRNINCA